MALNAGTAYVDVIPQLSKSFASDVGKDVSKASKDAEGDVEKAGSGIGSKYGNAIRQGVGLFAGFQAAEALKSTFIGSVHAASDLSETLNKTKVVFGDAGDSVIAWSKNSATAFGLSQNAALSAVSTYGDMFSQLGFGKQQAAGMSEGMVKLAADLGSFHNVDPSDVLERMGAALRGEYDSLQQLIPNINAARVEQEAMAMTGKTAASALTAQEKAAATLAIVQKDGANADNDRAETASGLANTMNTLSAKTEDLKAKFGAVLLPAMSAAATFMADTFIPGIETTGKAFGKLAGFVEDNKVVFGVAAGVITTVFLPAMIAAGVQATISGAKIVTAWVATQVAAIASSVTTSAIVLLYVADWVVMGAQSLLNAAKVVAGWVMTSAAAIGAGVVFGVQVALQVAGWILLGAQSLINAAKVAAAWLIAMGPIGLVVAAVIGVVALIIANWDTIVAVTKKLWQWVQDATGVAWEWLKSTISKALDFLVTLFLNFTGPGLLIKHFDTIKEAAAAAFRWIADRATEFVNFFIGLPGKIAASTSGMFDGIKDAFRAALNWIINKWNDLRFTLPEIDTHIPGIGTVGGFTLDTPNLPTFAKGGIARGTFIAGELGPELVTVGQTARVYTAGDTAMMTAGQGASVVEKHYHYHNESKLEDPLVDQFKELERLGLPI